MKNDNIKTAQTMYKSLIKFITLLAFSAVNLLGGHAYAERTTTYFHSDGGGSIVAASDENGDLLWRKQYQPFGAQIEGSNSSEETSFTGKQFDKDTGLTYFGARYYDPMIGRFTSVDPVSPLAGAESSPYLFNRYAYSNNNPYRYLDPDGRVAFLIPVIVFLAKEGAAEVASHYTGGATDFLSFRKLGQKGLKYGVRTLKGTGKKPTGDTKKPNDGGGEVAKKEKTVKKVNPKKSVTKSKVGEEVATPDNSPESFTKLKGGQGYRNKKTGEIFQKSNTNHSGDPVGEYKVGTKPGATPTKSNKTTVTRSDCKVSKKDGC